MTELQHFLEVLKGLGRGLWWLWLFLGTIGLVTLAASGAAVAAVTVGVTRTTASSSR